MSNVLADHRVRQPYRHADSQAERAAAAARKKPPGPMAVLRARHDEEVSDLQARHGAENTKLRLRRDRIRDDYAVRHTGAAMPHADVKKMKAEVDALRDKHADEASAVGARHRRELEAAIQKNPLP
jgi:hypothetical protein